MSKQILPKVYVDTNVFVYHLIPISSSRSKKQAKNFFMDIQNQKLKGITSSFTKTEYLAVVKREYSRILNRKPSKTLIDSFIKALDDFIKNMGIEYHESDKLVTNDKDFFSNVHNQVYDAKPVKRNSNWKICSAPDAIILSMAEKTNSDELITNDDGFSGTNTKIKIKILRDVY